MCVSASREQEKRIIVIMQGDALLKSWIVGSDRVQSYIGGIFFPIFLKGTVSRDFLLLVFLMNQFPPSPRVVH